VSVAAALLLALQGAGAPGSLTFDVRCMVVLGQLAGSGDESMRAAASTASQYYFGRIDGRVPDTALEEAIWRETRGLVAGERERIVQACAAHMQQRGQRLVEIGNRISAREGQPARQ
jgi:hypothetical protein